MKFSEVMNIFEIINSIRNRDHFLNYWTFLEFAIIIWDLEIILGIHEHVFIFGEHFLNAWTLFELMNFFSNLRTMFYNFENFFCLFWTERSSTILLNSDYFYNSQRFWISTFLHNHAQFLTFMKKIRKLNKHFYKIPEHF